MRKGGMGLAALTLLAGCSQGAETRQISAVVEANLGTGEALLTCRQSSSGTCHAVYITDAQRITAAVRQGEVGNTQGLSPVTRYCIDVTPPDPASCNPRALSDGEQIYRSSTVTHGKPAKE